LIIDNAVIVLRVVNETMGTYLVDQPCGAAGESANVVDRTVGEGIMLRASECHVASDVTAGLHTVVVRQLSL
jgi:hypothetical protein